ncbi:hypothetical protein H2200_013033 [Cladophialophora chaetospira]|uniref:Ankyrin repeat domain-containing protein n=1 Tax=Cladophialophora chaetospira TaxID=386627 RepID=A0AA38WWN1_9EURO|nr:hypothetical protein H2200_013033 [Cladophialophora chaetospira]
MCKFLIENGADVEEVAPLALEDDDVYKCTPLESILQRCEQQEYAERFLSFRDLLAAGADPTNGALAVCLEGNEEFDYLKLILDNPIPFVELEARDIDGNTPLLRAADFAATRSDSWRILNSLLTSGANIYARSLNDANCIQVLVRNLFDFPGADRYLEVQTCLVLLIQAGADVHAFDEKGISIFDIAYRDCPGLCSAYLGDIWDSVLSICGYDIREARKGFHRVAAYRTFGNDCVAYTREKFELLWDGREKLCPYYNDPVIWCPFSVSPSGSCPYGGTRQVCPGPERELLSKEEPLRCRHCCPGGVADFEPDESEKGECEGAGFVEDELGKGAMYGGDSIAN